MELKEMLEAYAKVPELSSFKNPLFVGPHPDDIEFGCGALISKMKNNGANIHFLIVTDGAAGTDDPNLSPAKLKDIREKEARKAASFLGASSIDFIGLEDGGTYTVQDVTREVCPYILKYMPDIIFTVDPMLKSETHPDHLKVGEGVRRTLQMVGFKETLRRNGVNTDGIKEFPRNIYLAYYFSDDPNTYVEINEKNLNDKFSSLMIHESQLNNDSLKILIEYFKLKAAIDGAKSGYNLAESYLVISPNLNHVYSLGLHN